MAEALAERGLKPDLLAGHSVGEIAAAHISGVLDLADAAKLITARGALMGALPAGGAMAAIEATEAEVAESIEGREAELSLAAVNGPSSTVISGAEEAVAGDPGPVGGQGQADQTPRRLPRLPLAADGADAGGVRRGLLLARPSQEPQIPIVSNLTGETLSAEQATDPAYWVRHAREAVRFADTVATLQTQGATTFVELGPDPVLLAMAQETLGEEAEAAFVPTLREGREEAGAIVATIAAAHAAGARLDWAAFFAGTGAKRVPLPTYPFQRAALLARLGQRRRRRRARPARRRRAPAARRRRSRTPATASGLLLTGRISLADPPLAGRPRRRRRGAAAGHGLPRAGPAAPPSRSARRRSRS